MGKVTLAGKITQLQTFANSHVKKQCFRWLEEDSRSRPQSTGLFPVFKHNQGAHEGFPAVFYHYEPSTEVLHDDCWGPWSFDLVSSF